MKDFKKIVWYVMIIGGSFLIGLCFQFMFNKWVSPNQILLKEVIVYKDKIVEVPVDKIIIKYKDKIVKDTVDKIIIKYKDKIVEVPVIIRDTIYFPIIPKYLVNWKDDSSIFSPVPEVLPISRLFEIMDRAEPEEKEELWKELAIIGLTSLLTYGITRIK